MSAGPAPVVAGSFGVFGGFSDPIRYAHLAVAQGRPPKRRHSSGSCWSCRPASRRTEPDQSITSGSHRLAMVELAIAGPDRFAVDRVPSEENWTVDTFGSASSIALSGRWIAGADADPCSARAFLGLATWPEPHRNPWRLARLASRAPRDGYPDALRPAFVADHFPDMVDRVVFLDGPRMRLSALPSSGGARRPVARSPTWCAGCGRARYIDDHDLYI